MSTPCETERIANGVINQTLPKIQWTHQAHLRAGLWHVLHYDDAMALELMRTRIRAYNEATGVANTATTGYHETITRFYLLMMRDFLNGLNLNASLDAPLDLLSDQMIDKLGDREFPFQYYTRERLFSTQARAGWVPPDLAALPNSSD